VEYSLKYHLTRDTENILYILGDLVLSREVLVGRRVVRGFNKVVLEDEGIKLDNLPIRIEYIDD